MEYLPGPWTAEGERIHSSAPTGTRLGLHIATVHDVDGLRDTLDANARLIAQAPALLEALEAAAAGFVVIANHSPADTSYRSALPHGQADFARENFRKARAAIRQAKGEA